MPKQVTSTVKGFPGVVVFHEPLFYEQVAAFEDARDAAASIEPSAFWSKIAEARGEKDENGETIKIIWTSRTDNAFLPAIFACVKEWHLEGLPEKPTLETFPFTPRDKTHELVEWLVGELRKIIDGEETVPNELSPTPITTQ